MENMAAVSPYKRSRTTSARSVRRPIEEEEEEGDGFALDQYDDYNDEDVPPFEEEEEEDGDLAIRQPTRKRSTNTNTTKNPSTKVTKPASTATKQQRKKGKAKLSVLYGEGKFVCLY